MVARNYTSFSLDPTLKRSEMSEHLRRDDDNPSDNAITKFNNEMDSAEN